MNNYKITIEYDGTCYCGWQRQKNAVSIQQAIEQKLKKILSEKIRLTGFSRTDSGVHAAGQVANFYTKNTLKSSKIQHALNAHLPYDIRITGIKKMRLDFNAQKDAKTKIYRYSILNRKQNSPFCAKYALFYPSALNINKMRAASKILTGKHDFLSFKGAKGITKTSVRTVKQIKVSKRNCMIDIDIEATGFLYNMARIMVGTLIEVGRGKISPSYVKEILKFRNRKKAGPTAPARGLTLLKVKY